MFLEPVKILQRVAFIDTYLKILEEPNKMLFIIDEVGIGTSLIKHYAYSKKGERVNVTLLFRLTYPWLVEVEVFTTQPDLYRLYQLQLLRVDPVYRDRRTDT